MDKVLITGASGLLGREIVKIFSQDMWNVLGIAYSRAHGNLRKVNLFDETELGCVLDEFNPSVVVHCAAERRPDVMQKCTEKSQALNVSVTDSLATFCKQKGIFLLYISTDYVFDGKDSPYKPEAATNPLNLYGKSKRDGEKAVLKYPEFAVLRVPILYGPVEFLEESAVTTLFSSVLNSCREVKVSDYELRYPTHVSDCAQVCLGIANRHRSGINAEGIWHWSAKECFTKYTMACTMAKVFSLKSDHIIPLREPSSGAPRPFDCHLDTAATEKLLEIQTINFESGIRQVLEPFASNIGQ